MSGVTRQKVNVGDRDDEPLPESVQTDNDQPSTVSNLTAELPSIPDTNRLVLSHIEMALPPTPPCRVLQMPKFARFEEGYDSDNQMGPFFLTDLRQEEHASMNERDPEVEHPLTPPPVNESKIQDHSLLTPDTVRKTKVTELCDTLKDRGMSIKDQKGRSSVDITPGCRGRSCNSAKSTR